MAPSGGRSNVCLGAKHTAAAAIVYVRFPPLSRLCSGYQI
jgi:hypothetical protein